MMILKVTFTDKEVKEFFESNGFKVEDKPFGRWEKVAHNRSSYNEYYLPAVVVGDKFVEARKLFEAITELKVKKLICPTNTETKRIITNTLKKKFNGSERF